MKNIFGFLKKEEDTGIYRRISRYDVTKQQDGQYLASAEFDCAGGVIEYTFQGHGTSRKSAIENVRMEARKKSLDMLRSPHYNG